MNYSKGLLLIVFIILIGLSADNIWRAYAVFTVAENDASLHQLALAGLQTVLLFVIAFYTSSRLKLGQKVVQEKDSDLKTQKQIVAEQKGQIASQEYSLENFTLSDTQNYLHQLTENTINTLNVDNVAVWKFRENNEVLDCIDFFDSSEQQHKEGFVFIKEKYPTFLEVLSTAEIIDAPDIFQHEFLGEITHHYSQEAKAKSLLIIPIIYNKKVLGVYWIEQKGEQRNWTKRDKTFVAFMANLAALYLHQQKTNTEKKYLWGVEKRTRAFLESANTGIARLELNAPFSTTTTSLDEQIEEILEQSSLRTSNLAFADLYDIEHDLNGTPLSQLINPNDAEQLIKKFIDEEYNLGDTESSWELPNGEKMCFAQEILGIVEDGHLMGFWLVIKDISRLKKEAQFYTGLADNSSTLFTVIDTENKVIFENKAVLSLLGFDENERLGKNILSYIHEEDFENVEQAIQKSKEHKTIENFLSIQLRNKKGELHYTDCIITNQLENPAIEGIILEFNDLAEHKEKEEKLVSTKHFFKALVENSSEIFTVVNQENIIQYESPAMHKVFGHQSEVRLGRYGFECIHSEDVAKLEVLFKEVLESPNKNFQTTVQFLNANNQWHQLSLGMHNLLSNPDINGIVLKFENKAITAEEVLISPKEQLSESILQNASRVYLMTDQEGKITFVNDALGSQFGYEKIAVLGRNILEFIPKEKRSSVKANLQFLESDIHANITLELDIKNAKDQWAKATAKASSLVNKGKFEGILLQLENITEKLKKETEISFRARFYGTLVNSFSNIILFTNGEGKIKFANAVSKEKLGYKLQGELLDRLHSEDHKIVLANLESVENNLQKSALFTAKIIDKEGNWKPFDFQISNARNTSNFKGMIIEISEKS